MQQPIPPQLRTILNDGVDERSPLANDMKHFVFCKQGLIGIGNNQFKTYAADQLLHMRQTQHSNARKSLSQTPAKFPVPIIAKNPTSMESPVRFAPTPTDQVATIAKKPSPTEVLAVPTINVGEVISRPKTRETDVPAPSASFPAPSVENADSRLQQKSPSGLSFGAATAKFNAQKPQKKGIFRDLYPGERKLGTEKQPAIRDSFLFS